MFIKWFKGPMFEKDDDGAGAPIIEQKPKAEEKPAEEKPAADDAAKAAAKKYTEDDLNSLITKGKADAVAMLLKDLGIPTVADAKKNLAALKAWQDSQKTESQRAIDNAKAAEEGKTAAERRADAAELRLEALKNGAAPDKIDDVVLLAEKEEGATIADKVKAALEKRPWYKADAKPEEFGGKVKNQLPGSKEAAQAQVNEAFGLKGKG